jgi:glycerol uptake facilitator-like aquaporin
VKGDKAEFQVGVNSALEDPWGMGNGFAVQMVFIFILAIVILATTEGSRHFSSVGTRALGSSSPCPPR